MEVLRKNRYFDLIAIKISNSKFFNTIQELGKVPVPIFNFLIPYFLFCYSPKKNKE